MSVRIVKGKLRQEVSQQAFEKIYQKNGWRIDTSPQEPINNEVIQTVVSLPNDNQRQKYLSMEKRKRVSKVFDDGLFYKR